MNSKCRTCEAERDRSERLSKELEESRMKIKNVTMELSQFKEGALSISNKENVYKKVTEENTALRSKIHELEQTIERLQTKGGFRDELTRMKEAYNELETKYKRIGEERSVLIYIYLGT